MRRAAAVAVVLFVPLVAAAQQARTISLTATANPWQFTPGSFVVHVGDIVTLNLSVPANDPSSDGHGFLMVHYVEDAITIPRGQARQVTFVATTPGTFNFVCTVASCGLGHNSMFGQMVVDASMSITTVSPGSGPTAGGTPVTITGTGFIAPVTVTFGGGAARNVTLVDSSTIRATTPAHASGVVDVVVSAGGTSATKSNAFAYADPRRRSVRH